MLQHLLADSSSDRSIGDHRVKLTWANATSRALADALDGMDEKDLESASTTKAYAAMLC